MFHVLRAILVLEYNVQPTLHTLEYALNMS